MSFYRGGQLGLEVLKEHNSSFKDAEKKRAAENTATYRQARK
jgi:hypothetical protein